MGTTIVITLLIIAVASLVLNVYQYAEGRAKKKEIEKIVIDATRVEEKLAELQKTYDNEVLHKKWAIGRIKDQQAVIDQLKSNKSKYHGKRKEADNA